MIFGGVGVAKFTMVKLISVGFIVKTRQETLIRRRDPSAPGNNLRSISASKGDRNNHSWPSMKSPSRALRLFDSE